jgi:hypothetical protein
LLTQDFVLLAQILYCLLLLLIDPARDRDQHEPERIENAHPSTVSRVISAMTAIRIVFSAFEFLDRTRVAAVAKLDAWSHAVPKPYLDRFAILQPGAQSTMLEVLMSAPALTNMDVRFRTIDRFGNARTRADAGSDTPPAIVVIAYCCAKKVQTPAARR